MSIICPFCHIGSPKSELGTWAHLLGKYLVVLPGISVKKCDVCGHLEYDPILLARLDALLSAGKQSDAELQAHPSRQMDESNLLEEWSTNCA